MRPQNISDILGFRKSTSSAAKFKIVIGVAGALGDG